MANAPKRFWEMSKGEVDAWTSLSGLDAWKAKIAEDRAAAPEILARGPNPWAAASLDPRLQNVISQLAPEVARAMRQQADATS